METLNEECIQGALDNYLADYPYLDGYTPSQADTKLSRIFDCLKIDLLRRPHLKRWREHMRSFNDKELSQFPHEHKQILSRCTSRTSSNYCNGFQVCKLFATTFFFSLSSASFVVFLPSSLAIEKEKVFCVCNIDESKLILNIKL